MRKNKAFTILELLVVVAIIAILAVIAIPNFIGRIDEAKVSQDLAEINAVTKAVNTYYADKGVYPTLQGKDGTLLQAQPIDGSPHNIDFSSLVPNYLASLPHFSYWWVDYKGEVYHTEKTLGSLSGNVFTPVAGYTYTVYKPNGTTQVLSGAYTLQAGEYILGKDAKDVELPKISVGFKNAIMHPESPEAQVAAPVLKNDEKNFTVDIEKQTSAEVLGLFDASTTGGTITVTAEGVQMQTGAAWDGVYMTTKTPLKREGTITIDYDIVYKNGYYGSASAGAYVFVNNSQIYNQKSIFAYYNQVVSKGVYFQTYGGGAAHAGNVVATDSPWGNYPNYGTYCQAIPPTNYPAIQLNTVTHYNIVMNLTTGVYVYKQNGTIISQGTILPVHMDKLGTYVVVTFGNGNYTSQTSVYKNIKITTGL